MKVWLFKQESKIDGEVFFNVNVCENEKAAKELLEKEKNWILNDSFHFGIKYTEKEREEYCTIEEGDNRFFITDDSDDYYEELIIEETETIK